MLCLHLIQPNWVLQKIFQLPLRRTDEVLQPAIELLRSSLNSKEFVSLQTSPSREGTFSTEDGFFRRRRVADINWKVFPWGSPWHFKTIHQATIFPQDEKEKTWRIKREECQKVFMFGTHLLFWAPFHWRCCEKKLEVKELITKVILHELLKISPWNWWHWDNGGACSLGPDSIKKF